MPDNNNNKRRNLKGIKKDKKDQGKDDNFMECNYDDMLDYHTKLLHNYIKKPIFFIPSINNNKNDNKKIKIKIRIIVVIMIS